MKLFVYVVVVVTILEGFYCAPAFWEDGSDGTTADVQKNFEINILGLPIRWQRDITYDEDSLGAKLLGLFVPQDSEVTYNRGFRLGIPNILEYKSHKTVDVQNHSDDDNGDDEYYGGYGNYGYDNYGYGYNGYGYNGYGYPY